MNRKLTEQEFIELTKCRRDPGYFLRTYAFIWDPVKGKLPFSLFDFQEVCLQKFLAFAFNIVLKPRQMGLSWLVAGFALWLCLFFKDKKVLMISIKDKTAKALLKKVKYIYKNLPEFLQGELVDDNMSRIAFSTGSEIESVPTSEEAGRSESLSLLIIDEGAFIRWIERIWQASYPTLSTGGMAIILSTANGMANFYHKLWQKSIEGKSLFNPIRLHWYYHPDRNREWYEIQQANMSQMQLAQEVLADFVASGNLVFDLSSLRAMHDECSMISPIETLYMDENDPRNACGLYLFQRPVNFMEYILSVDTAKGGAGDYHAAHVLEKGTGAQVAEYRTKVPLDIFNRRLFELGMLYNGATTAVENNFGVATIFHLLNGDYPNVWEYTNPLKQGSKEHGFPTNSLTRPILIEEMEASIREGVSGVQGIRTVNEMMSFAWSKKAKAEAMAGNHDDLVISYGIGRYVRKTSVGTNVPFFMPMSVY